VYETKNYYYFFTFLLCTVVSCLPLTYSFFFKFPRYIFFKHPVSNLTFYLFLTELVSKNNPFVMRDLRVSQQCC
jgi:hypothetical protein